MVATKVLISLCVYGLAAAAPQLGQNLNQEVIVNDVVTALQPSIAAAVLASLDHPPQPSPDSPPLASPATLALLLDPPLGLLLVVLPASVPTLDLPLALVSSLALLALVPALALLPSLALLLALLPTLDLPQVLLPSPALPQSLVLTL